MLALLLLALLVLALLALVLLALLAAFLAAALLLVLLPLAAAGLAHAALALVLLVLLLLAALVLTVLLLSLRHGDLLWKLPAGHRRGATRTHLGTPPRPWASDEAAPGVGGRGQGSALRAASYSGSRSPGKRGGALLPRVAGMSSSTSIGPEGRQGGNDSPGNADGCGNKTLGVGSDSQVPPAGAESVVGQAAPDVPAGVAGAKPRPGVERGKDAYPDGPNVESSPWELQAARGKPPKQGA